MALLNVRLGPEDQRLADELRGEGVPIARIVRDAIRSEHARRVGKRGTKRTAAKLVAEIFERHPDPPGAPHHGIDTTDRRAVQRYVARQLKRQKP